MNAAAPCLSPSISIYPFRWSRPSPHGTWKLSAQQRIDCPIGSSVDGWMALDIWISEGCLPVCAVLNV